MSTVDSILVSIVFLDISMPLLESMLLSLLLNSSTLIFFYEFIAKLNNIDSVILCFIYIYIYETQI